MFIDPTVHFPFSKRFCHFWAFLIFDKMLFVAKINMSLQSQIALDLWLWNSRLINCMAKQMMPYFTGHLFGTCLCNKIYECLIMKHPVEFGSERTILDASFDVKKKFRRPLKLSCVRPSFFKNRCDTPPPYFDRLQHSLSISNMTHCGRYVPLILKWKQFLIKLLIMYLDIF